MDFICLEFCEVSTLSIALRLNDPAMSCAIDYLRYSPGYECPRYMQTCTTIVHSTMLRGLYCGGGPYRMRVCKMYTADEMDTALDTALEMDTVGHELILAWVERGKPTSERGWCERGGCERGGGVRL